MEKMIRSIFFLLSCVLRLFSELFLVYTRRENNDTRNPDTHTVIHSPAKLPQCSQLDILNDFFLFDLTTVFLYTHIHLHCQFF